MFNEKEKQRFCKLCDLWNNKDESEITSNDEKENYSIQIAFNDFTKRIEMLFRISFFIDSKVEAEISTFMKTLNPRRNSIRYSDYETIISTIYNPMDDTNRIKVVSSGKSNWKYVSNDSTIYIDIEGALKGIVSTYIGKIFKLDNFGSYLEELENHLSSNDTKVKFKSK